MADGIEDTDYTISAAELLAGFTDVDGDILGISGLSATNGTLADNGDGTWTFTPDVNFNGVVGLSYFVKMVTVVRPLRPSRSQWQQ
ncbi:cadherin-like domain-containing protein (plasmid) [Mesorhizobium sp. AaZ16]|uniref:cadherin-like domain-containing protein n=1 Tax=Mesorhizobium sp. AaZ16 TaxID=3402289 RepID=UPI00374F5605